MVLLPIKPKVWCKISARSAKEIGIRWKSLTVARFLNALSTANVLLGMGSEMPLSLVRELSGCIFLFSTELQCSRYCSAHSSSLEG